MAETEAVTQPKKRRAGLRKWGGIGGGLLLLIVAMYFVAASSAFVKGVVLPRLSRALNAEITVAEVSFSPFSQIVMRGFRVQTTGAEPVLQAEEARLRYHLWSLIKGRIDMEELKLVSPRLVVTQKADGTSNLDPLIKALTAPPEAGAVPPKAKPPTQIALKNVALSQGLVRWTQESKGGERQTAELSPLNVAIDRLQNAQAGKLTLSIEGKYERGPLAPSPAATNDLLQAKLSGAYDFKLDSRLLPQTLSGAVRLEVLRAQGAWREMAGLGGMLECHLTPSEIRQLVLRFERQANPLGQLRISGLIDLAKTEGRLKLEVLSLDRRVLNLFGAAMGWDFARSVLNATNRVDVSQQGQFIAANGRLTGSQASVRQKDRATPAVDLDLDYQFNLDLKNQTALLQRLNLSGKQGSNELLRAQLNRPMNFAWGSSLSGFKESAFEFSVTNLNLAEWNLLLGETAPTGWVALNGKVVAQEDGRQLSAEFSAHGRDLTAQWATNRLALAQFQGQVRGRLVDFQKLSVDPYNFAATETNQTLVSGNGSLNYDLNQGDLSLRTTIEASLPGVLQKFPLASLNASAGTIRFSGLFTRQKRADTMNGTMSLVDFTGRYGDYLFESYQAGLEADLELKDEQLQINRANFTARQSFESGGSCNLSGRYDLNQKTVQLTFLTVGLNQTALGPFLAPWLAPRALVSASFNAQGSANYDPKKDARLKADIKVTNFVLKDPQIGWPAVPLNAHIQLDGSLNPMQLVRLNQVGITLLDGAEPCGHGDVTGTLDLAKNTTQLTFKVADLNQRALAPWAAPWVAPKTLISATVNANGTASYEPQKDSSLKAQLSVTNVVVNDPANKLPVKPLQATLQIDGALRQNIAELRQFVVGLSPTARATNQIQLQGRLDLSKTNAMTGQLALHADSLDLTPAYELLTATGPTNAPAANAPAANAPAAPTVPTNSAAAKTVLPVQNLQVESKIDRLYLGEIAITNWQALAKINPSEIHFDPIQFALNSGSITGHAVLNLGVPGYAIDLSLQAVQVPVEPVVNTFLPESRGQYQGQVSGQVQLKDGDITGIDWTKNLTGQVAFNYTNANMPVVSPRIQSILKPVALLLRTPEILQTPVDAINGSLKLGQGQVEFPQLTVFSAAYQADGQGGTITLAPVLTNSPVDIPVAIALRRSLAQKVNLIPPGTPASAEYVKLPNFARVKGTLGAYETKTDKLVIAGLLTQSVTGIAGVEGQAGNALSGIGSLLTGDKSALTNQLKNLVPGLATSTNAARLTNLAPQLLTNLAPQALTNLASPSNLNVGTVLGGLSGLLTGAKSSLTNRVPGLAISTNAARLTNLAPQALTNLIPGVGIVPQATAGTNRVPNANTNLPPPTNTLNLLRNLLGR